MDEDDLEMRLSDLEGAIASLKARALVAESLSLTMMMLIDGEDREFVRGVLMEQMQAARRSSEHFTASAYAALLGAFDAALDET